VFVVPVFLALTVCAGVVAAPCYAQAIEPARPDLVAVSTPRLEDLEAAVATQIRDAQDSVRGVVARGGSSRALADAYGSLARVYHAYEFLESAEPAYVNARRLAPGNSDWPHLLGVLYQQTGRLDEAAEALAAARRLQPKDHAAAVYLGDVYLGLNRPADARDQFHSVIDVLPAVARRGLGDVAMRERKFAEAVGHYLAVLDRVPQAAAVHYSLAMAYRGLGRLDQARALLERRGRSSVRAADPLVDSLQTLLRGERPWVMRGRSAYDAEQFHEAADAFSNAVRAAPSSVDARVNLGSTMVQLGEIAAAIEQFRAALALDADNAAAQKNLGRLLAGERRDAEAERHLRAAFDRAPDDAAVISALTGSLVRLGRSDDAIAVLTRARGYRPDDEETAVALAILLAGRARYREAIALLDTANQQFPERIATATTLARLLASSPDRSLRDGPRAFELARVVYASAPSPVHGETIALALAELGRCEEAVGWMKTNLAQAERANDAAEVTRLKEELPKYEAASCRPPGQ
jgi:tetratricopeptide (TPR) repeat protein